MRPTARLLYYLSVVMMTMVTLNKGHPLSLADPECLHHPPVPYTPVIANPPTPISEPPLVLSQETFDQLCQCALIVAQNINQFQILGKVDGIGLISSLLSFHTPTNVLAQSLLDGGVIETLSPLIDDLKEWFRMKKKTSPDEYKAPPSFIKTILDDLTNILNDLLKFEPATVYSVCFCLSDSLLLPHIRPTSSHFLFQLSAYPSICYIYVYMFLSHE